MYRFYTHAQIDEVNRRAYLGVMQALSKSLWVDADVNVTALVHELQVSRELHPRCAARERQVQLQ